MPKLPGVNTETVWHPPTPPTLDDHGSEVHPAFGMISVHRSSVTPGAVLFDSDITHQSVITLTLSQATRKRNLHRDWIHGGSRTLVEVQMSEAQWASAVSSVNTSGVPVTIRRLPDNVNVDGLEYEPRLGYSMDEVKDGTRRVFKPIEAAVAAYSALTSKATAAERKAAWAAVEAATRHASANLAFAADSLTEHAENVVQKARADVETMVAQKAAALGLTEGQAQGLVALPISTDGPQVIEQ